MRIATFGLDPAAEESLAAGPSEAVRCYPDSPEGGMLPAALEAAESALDRAGADAALIGGDDDWALAAALACAKAVVPYAFIHGEGDREGGNAGHIERLSEAVIATADSTDAVQRWLATLGD